MERRNRSAIWNHFDKSENLKAKCKYCSQNISIASGSLGNLSRHMKAKHPTLKTVAEREIQGPLADGQNLDNVPHLLEPQPATSNMQDERLVRMIVKEYQPISIVEDKEFKKFVNMLNPGYSLPTRKTISQTLIPNLYLSELEKLKNRMQYMYRYTYEKEQQRLQYLFETVTITDTESDHDSDEDEISSHQLESCSSNQIIDKGEEYLDSESDCDEADFVQEPLEAHGSNEEANITYFEPPLSNTLSFLGKDKQTRWKKVSPLPKNTKTRSENIIKVLPGPKEIIDTIVIHTNEMIEGIQANFARDRDANFTNSDEIHALLGLLYLAGKYKASHLNLDDLWKADGSGIEIFRLMAVRPGDPKFEETLLRWNDELKNECDSDNGGSDYEDNVSVQSESDSTVLDEDSEEEPTADQVEITRKEKNGHLWSSEPQYRTRTPRRNIVVRVPGPKGIAKNVSTELEAWKLFVSDDVINKIVLYTNMEIGRQKSNYSQDCGYINNTDDTEILALIGLLYIS
ncbi:unnamed protein product [Acanthoscelides obtectus]|uniref:BED-type domain-containing protein n=1 Tax=Acanthoscelides obtectus TaxID=200917 RepID=A0A9P0JLP1_ACAOB|nr:unnamed protein product [Acanthoscelides obtectus]CAK1642920.1 hypothetical protein AOBTE_LOCUS13295 [Acanthoscelides obtectus]